MTTTMPQLPFSTDALLESLEDAFIAFDQNWHFTYLNPRAEQFLGKKREDLLGKVYWEEYPQIVGTELHTRCLEAVASKQSAVFEYFSPQEKRWTRFSLNPFPEGLALFARDVTDAHVANTTRTHEALRASEERFRLLVEGVRDYAIFLLDTEGYVTTWNSGAQRFKGYTADEIIGQHFSRFYTPEDIARRHPWAELEIAAREGKYEEEGWRIRKDGSRFWANVVITALRDESGALRGFGKVTRDITERRQREQERAANEVLEQQRRFLKDVLLSVTEGRLMLCDSPSELPAPLFPDLPTLDREAEPIPLTKSTLQKTRHRVADVASVCGLTKESSRDLVTATSEGAMNAIQHAGGGIARVLGSASVSQVQVWVEDTGSGIDLSHLPRATLEPGFSVAHGRGGIGHGFSLMIACCHRLYLLTGSNGTTLVLEQARHRPEPAWLLAENSLRKENEVAPQLIEDTPI